MTGQQQQPVTCCTPADVRTYDQARQFHTSDRLYHTGLRFCDLAGTEWVGIGAARRWTVTRFVTDRFGKAHALAESEPASAIHLGDWARGGSYAVQTFVRFDTLMPAEQLTWYAGRVASLTTSLAIVTAWWDSDLKTHQIATYRAALDLAIAEHDAFAATVTEPLPASALAPAVEAPVQLRLF